MLFTTLAHAKAFAKRASAHKQTIWVVNSVYYDDEIDAMYEYWYCVADIKRPVYPDDAERHVCKGYYDGRCVMSCA